jgi:hypothetical protein
MRLVRTRHTFVRLAAILAAGALLLWGVLYMNQIDRDRINRTFSAPDPQQIKPALDAYLQTHEGVYPPRLDVLVESGLIADRNVLSGISFPAAGKRKSELSASDYVAVQREHPWSEHKEMTPPQFALRADGKIEYARK